MTTTSTRRRWSRSAVARVSAAKSSTVCGSSRPTVASMRSATRTPFRRNGFMAIRCLTRLRRSQVVRKAEYASTSRRSTSTPIASYPSVNAQLSVVPRPASGSRTVRRVRSGRSAAATVMFSRTRVSCSLVLPGYLGMVSRSSSNRSPSGASTGRSNPLSRSKTAKVAASPPRTCGSTPSASSTARYGTPASDVGAAPTKPPGAAADTTISASAAVMAGASPAYTRLLDGASRTRYSGTRQP